ncbi:gliding motility protein GldB-related protein [Pontibacter mangrovi]|uniref:Uncharacterized protein n=1 Tax=Pontibacter mangrovi TaxID=2589816 RepID=A0A501WBQ9_9BACT|nr:DUF2268 domain-containing putative Zn-dependent protease [Pontibacter mangrovi]TPE45820.1 hypothetical protein FJM65_00280 [Pontibacter mangrovi]
MKKLYALLTLLLTSAAGYSQASFQIVTSDVDLFWNAFDKLKEAQSKEDSVRVLDEEYLQKASAGVKQFTPGRIRNAAYLQKVINRHPQYYTQLKGHTHKLQEAVPKMQAHYGRLKELYPDTNIPRVYFVVGAMNSAGTIADDPVIGVDMFGLYPNTPTEELGNWHKAVLKPMDQIDLVVIHEFIHILQRDSKGDSTLLGMSIGEGAADFVATLAANGHINKVAHAYGDKHEQALWEEFRAGMHQGDVSNWLYNGENMKERPADLGYYMGYKICEAYYNKATDKKQAVRDILRIQDYAAFLEKSGYAQKFN